MPFAARLRTLLTRLGGFVLAGGLLWLALRGVDPNAVRDALVAGDYRWFAPLVLACLGAHALRALRWRLLLAGLPGTRVPSFGLAFAAVMMGYAVNYVLPRAGEVVRTGVVARRTQTPFAAVLGTVVLDRLLDIVMLVIGLATVPFLLRNRLDPLVAVFAAPLRDRLAGFPVWPVLGALTVGVAAGVWWWARRRARRQLQAEARTRPPGRLVGLARSFSEGLAALSRAPHRATLVALTVAMWGLYLLMAYLPFLLLRTAAPYGLTLVDGWSIMLLGSLGMVVPSPGGAGSFHYVTVLTLTDIWALARADAATYAVLAHAAQLVVYAVAGAVSFVALTVWGKRGAPILGDRSAPGADASHPEGDGSGGRA